MAATIQTIHKPTRARALDTSTSEQIVTSNLVSGDDSTFAAGLLGNILGGLGISVNAAQGAKKKNKEEGENGVIGNSSGGTQTIIIKQPLEIVTAKPNVIKVDPNKPKS